MPMLIRGHGGVVVLRHTHAAVAITANQTGVPAHSGARKYSVHSHQIPRIDSLRKVIMKRRLFGGR